MKPITVIRVLIYGATCVMLPLGLTSGIQGSLYKLSGHDHTADYLTVQGLVFTAFAVLLMVVNLVLWRVDKAHRGIPSPATKRPPDRSMGDERPG